MKNFLRSFFIISTLCYSTNALAMLEYDDKDLQDSKSKFLITNASYKDLDQKRQGTLTLCFKKQDESHAALLFEVFLPTSSHDISLRMVHYAKEDDCCGFGGKEKITIESSGDVLKKAYRALSKSNISVMKEHVPATYTTYASWILPNDMLIKGLVQAENDEKIGESSSSVAYVSKIMKVVGLNKVNFGSWRTTSSNLKILVDKHIEPSPSYTKNELPRY